MHLSDKFEAGQPINQTSLIPDFFSRLVSQYQIKGTDITVSVHVTNLVAHNIFTRSNL